jgi:type IV pilus assembly protein PilE
MRAHTCGRLPVRAQAGFTLIELMVVLAIMGILLSLAAASYSDHQRKSRRLDAQEALQSLQQAQARYRDQHPTYANNLIALGASDRSSLGHYQLGITQADENGYILVATAVGRQSGDEACNPMRLQLSDKATFTQSGGSEARESQGCWKR